MVFDVFSKELLKIKFSACYCRMQNNKLLTYLLHGAEFFLRS